MISGILLLDKPLGLSSNHALQRVRRACGGLKAGHTGSLDPLASGMLPICLGEATKIAGDLLEGRKCYRFTVRLGERSATGDAEGAILERRPVPPGLDATLLATAAERFVGATTQIPPMYSALKQQGQPLYRLARQGIEVERAARHIQIEELTLEGLSGGDVSWRVLCSKGTYVRVLAEDLARVLGTCGHVTALRREYVEPFAGFPMLGIEALTAGAVVDAVLPADQALPHLPAVELPASAAARLRQGQALSGVAPGPSGRVKLYETGAGFFGLGERDGTGVLRARRLFVSHEIDP